MHACSPVSLAALPLPPPSLPPPQDQGNRTTPSYVAFSDTERLIGEAAKNQAAAVRDRRTHSITVCPFSSRRRRTRGSLARILLSGSALVSLCPESCQHSVRREAPNRSPLRRRAGGRRREAVALPTGAVGARRGGPGKRRMRHRGAAQRGDQTIRARGNFSNGTARCWRGWVCA